MIIFKLNILFYIPWAGFRFFVDALYSPIFIFCKPIKTHDSVFRLEISAKRRSLTYWFYPVNKLSFAIGYGPTYKKLKRDVPSKKVDNLLEVTHPPRKVFNEII